MMEALSLGFMQNALLAGLLASVACGLIGSLVVVNRLVFMAGGVAHAAYGGVGMAVFLGLPVLLGALGFTVVAAMLMAWVTLYRDERRETAVGALWAGGMATGILLLDITPGYNVDLMSYLFGSILAVPAGDLWVMLVLDVVILAVVLAWYKDFLAMAYDEEFARARGAPVEFLHFALLVLVAVTVVMLVRVVGLTLIIALLSIPPAMARRQCCSLAGMMRMATLYAALFSLGGLALAYAANLTSGACIIAVAVTAFLLDEIRRWIMGRKGAAS